MKKGLMLIPLLLLSACGPKNYSILAVSNLDLSYDQYIEPIQDISVVEITNMINAGVSFPIVYHSDTCSSCVEAVKTIKSYAVNTGYKFYGFQHSQYGYNLLNKNFPNIFTSNLTYPNLLFINNKSLSYSISKGHMETLEGFTTVAKQHFIPSKINIVSNKDAFIDFTNKPNLDYVTMLYSSSKDTQLSYLETIKNYSYQSNKNLIIIDTNYAESSLITYLDIPAGKENICFNTKNNQRSEIADYLTDEGKQLIKGFFQIN